MQTIRCDMDEEMGKGMGMATGIGTAITSSTSVPATITTTSALNAVASALRNGIVDSGGSGVLNGNTTDYHFHRQRTTGPLSFLWDDYSGPSLPPTPVKPGLPLPASTSSSSAPSSTTTTTTVTSAALPRTVANSDSEFSEATRLRKQAFLQRNPAIVARYGNRGWDIFEHGVGGHSKVGLVQPGSYSVRR